MSWFWSSDKPAESNESVYEGLDADLKDFAQGKSPAAIPEDAQTAASIQASRNDAVDLYKQSSKSRKSFVNAGAVFNCAVAEYDLNECFRTGSWWDKAKLCELQKKTFWDCLNGNKQMLIANGYGEYGNTEAQNEALLADADDRYSKQLREQAAADARTASTKQG
jgi:hypothetical protein